MRPIFPEDLVDATIAGDEAAVRAALAADPDAPRRSLHAAAALAMAEPALALLDAQPSLAQLPAGRRGWTPLLYACLARHRRGEGESAEERVRIARRLLELGADVTVRGREPGFEVDVGSSPIQGAAERVASPALVRLLLAAGGFPGDPDQMNFLGAAVRGGSREVLEIALSQRQPEWRLRGALQTCVELDRADMTAMVVARFPPGVSTERALAAGVRLGRGVELLALVLGDGQAGGPARQRCYRLAFRHGHGAAADLLIRHGANTADVSVVDRVIAAAVAADRARLDPLLADPAYRRSELEPDDHRMLSWAIRTGRQQAVPLLLAAGLDVNVRDLDGSFPLHLAVAARSPEVVEALLAAGADVAALDFDDRTALDAALVLADPVGDRIARRLRAAGARSSPPVDRARLVELFERAADAVAFGDLDRLRALLDEEPALVHARSPRRHRAMLLHYCGANGTEAPRQRTPPNAPAVAQLLLDRGADANAVCRIYRGEDTTLWLMLTSGYPPEAGLDGELVRVLARGGARLEVLEHERQPMLLAIDYGLHHSSLALAEAGVPLDNLLLAAAANRVDLLEQQLAGGADVNTRYWEGYTALHAAAACGHYEAAAFLLARGADPTLRERRYDDTPLDKAKWRRHSKIEELLTSARPLS
jgi:ankyrin repeat protein